MTLAINDPASIEITNLGGINALSTEIPPGVTILSGENATNRSSFLRAVSAALGGDESSATLKSDADEGKVTLEIADNTVTREFVRSNDQVIRSGDPSTDDPQIVDAYASIFSSNPARSSIRTGGDGLRDILMSGVDTEAITSRIESLKQEKSSLQNTLSQIENTKKELPKLREQSLSLEENLDTINSEIELTEDDIENYEASNEEIQEAEKYLSELKDIRDKLRRTTNEIDETNNLINELKNDRDELHESLEDISVADDRKKALSEKLRSVETEISDLQSTITDLNGIISNNKSILEGDDIFDHFGSDDSVASQLNPAEATVQCWTCGSSVERSTIQGRVETLTAIRDEKNERLQNLRETRSTMESEIMEVEKAVEKRQRLQDELQDVERAIESERDSLENLEHKKETLRKDLEEVERRVDETEELRDSELKERYQRLSELQHQRGKVEEKLRSIRNEIEDKEEQIEKEETVQSQLEQVREDLSKTRGQIERIENEVVEKFNVQMEDLIDLLGYENISRIWLERKESSGSSSAEFDIHLVRESASGTVYEDTLDNLSESEREIIGIVVALSGYLVHDLAESVPVVLLDSVEAIDAHRLEQLFEYITDYAPYILVALLPEDAAAIDKRTIEAPTFPEPTQ